MRLVTFFLVFVHGSWNNQNLLLCDIGGHTSQIFVRVFLWGTRINNDKARIQMYTHLNTEPPTGSPDYIWQTCISNYPHLRSCPINLGYTKFWVHEYTVVLLMQLPKILTFSRYFATFSSSSRCPLLATHFSPKQGRLFPVNFPAKPFCSLPVFPCSASSLNSPTYIHLPLSRGSQLPTTILDFPCRDDDDDDDWGKAAKGLPKSHH